VYSPSPFATPADQAGWPPGCKSGPLCVASFPVVRGPLHCARPRLFFGICRPGAKPFSLPRKVIFYLDAEPPKPNCPCQLRLHHPLASVPHGLRCLFLVNIFFIVASPSLSKVPTSIPDGFFCLHQQCTTTMPGHFPLPHQASFSATRMSTLAAATFPTHKSLVRSKRLGFGPPLFAQSHPRVIWVTRQAFLESIGLYCSVTIFSTVYNQRRPLLTNRISSDALLHLGSKTPFPRGVLHAFPLQPQFTPGIGFFSSWPLGLATSEPFPSFYLLLPIKSRIIPFSSSPPPVYGFLR